MLFPAPARRRPPNPIIPGNVRDRTGTGSILRKALAEVDRRFAGLRVDVVALFDAVPTFALNDIRPGSVAYGMTPEQLAQMAVDLNAALDRWLVQGRGQAGALWWSPFHAQAAQLGAAQAAANLGALSTAYAAARSLEQIVFSVPYRNRLAMAEVRDSEYWTGLSGEARGKLAGIIGRAVVDGRNPKAVRTEIAEALDVSRSRAANYAQTEITNTLRETRMAEADHARVDMGIAVGLLWTSALIPTTRPWHASRNGKVYTTEEVRQFYDQRGNRFRCHCACTEALLDTNGAPILTDGLRTKMNAEREAWEGSPSTSG